MAIYLDTFDNGSLGTHRIARPSSKFSSSSFLIRALEHPLSKKKKKKCVARERVALSMEVIGSPACERQIWGIRSPLSNRLSTLSFAAPTLEFAGPISANMKLQPNYKKAARWIRLANDTYRINICRALPLSTESANLRSAPSSSASRLEGRL